MTSTSSNARKGRRRRGATQNAAADSARSPATIGIEGGRYRPLADGDLVRIDRAAREIVQQVGLSEAPGGVADRRTIDEWQDDGARDLREVALAKTRDILASYYPGYVCAEHDRLLRTQFDIRLPETDMCP